MVIYYLHVWQLVPENPAGHEHVYDPTADEQIPPLIQGLDAQKFITKTKKFYLLIKTQIKLSFSVVLIEQSNPV